MATFTAIATGQDMQQLHLATAKAAGNMKATFITTAPAGESHKIAAFKAKAAGQDMKQLHLQQQQQGQDIL
jgi:hypothetical protein